MKVYAKTLKQLRASGGSLKISRRQEVEKGRLGGAGILQILPMMMNAFRWQESEIAEIEGKLPKGRR
jgi:hypothetical protein